MLLFFHVKCAPQNNFYQRVSIASYANRWYSQRRHVRLSVCPSVRLSVCPSHSGIVSKRSKKASVMVSSPSESLNILVSRNVWLITKFDRGHPERGRFMRAGWRFCDFYQRVSIASYANRWYSQRRHVRLSVCPSVCPSHSGIVSKRRKLAS